MQREQAQMRQRREQIAKRIEGVEAQQKALITQRDLISQELEGAQSLLDKGLAQASRILALQREEARLAGQAGELTSNVAQAAEQITEIEIAPV